MSLELYGCEVENPQTDFARWCRPVAMGDREAKSPVVDATVQAPNPGSKAVALDSNYAVGIMTISYYNEDACSEHQTVVWSRVVGCGC